MLDVLPERRRFLDVVEFAVDLHPLEAAPLVVPQFLAVFALAAAHDRRHQQQAGAFRKGLDPVRHLGDALAFDGQAGRRRIGDADPGPEQAHVVVDLGDGGDGRARIARGRFLLDGDCRRQALDRIDIGLAHQLQELPRIGGEALHITALAFRIDGIESERRLARAGKPGDDDQPAARQRHIDGFQVVLPGAANDDPAGLQSACHDGSDIRANRPCIEAGARFRRIGADAG